MDNRFYYTGFEVGFSNPGTWSIYLREDGMLHSSGYPTREAADAVIRSLLYDMENPT